MKKFITLLLYVFLVSACTTHQGTFTIISKNVVNLDHVDIDKAEKIKNVEGCTTMHSLLFFNFGETNTGMEAAMTDAFLVADGDLFVDATVYDYTYGIPFIYTQSGTCIKGDMVKTRISR